MKKTAFFILLFSTFMQAQQTYPTYANMWQEVEKFETDNLPKSANEKVEKIYQLAKRENNAPQIVKTFLFRSKFAIILEEDAQLKVIHNLNQEIAEADYPTKNLLESILANLYWQYFQQNRWRFYNRTQTAEKVDANDFRTWDVKTLLAEVHLHFQRSLLNADQLQTTDLRAFENILTQEKDSKIYRPTLYDFLAHQALDFYKTDENSINQPTYKFELTNTDLIADYQTFANSQLTTQDTLSLQFNALKIYQDLTRFHSKNLNINGLGMLDLERLQFVKSKANFDKVNDLYVNTLEKTLKEFSDSPISTSYAYYLADIYYNNGLNYHPVNQPDKQGLLKKSLDICELAIKKFPNSNGALQCKNLKTTILQPSIQITAEQNIPENKPNKMLVTFKNLNEIESTAYKISDKELQKLSEIYNDDRRLTFIKNLSIAKSWNENLPLTHDYQTHNFEVLVPNLTQGQYLIVSEVPHTDIYGYVYVQVTDLALLEINSPQEQRMQVVNRITGTPISKATVRVFNKVNNQYDKPYDKTFITDTNGFINIPKTNFYNSIKVAIKTPDKSAIFGDYYLQNSNKSHPDTKPYYQVFCFTDRSIYRPGQQVYFKAIVVQRQPQGKITSTKVVPDTEIMAVLKNVNWEDVSKVNLTTNEFGSVSGSFILPEIGLNGMYNLQFTDAKGNISGNVSFSVEEYKRPKFETKFLPITDTFKVNDTVQVKGNATAYAGTAISEAKVTYRVQRKVQYPRWCYWQMPFYNSESQEITHGETTTDAQGNFIIDFTAIPDLKVKKEDFPVFQYEITADVTDLNGETRGAKTLVQVGYHSMLINLETPEKWQADANSKEFPTLKINTNNLNGEAIVAKGQLKIYKLKTETSVKRPRTWDAPDLQHWTRAEFERLFPYEFYQTVAQEPQTVGNPVFTTDFDTKKDDSGKNIPTEITLTKDFKNWTSGKYIVIIEAKDQPDNATVTDKTVVDIVRKTDNRLNDAELLKVTTDKDTYQPGETLHLSVGTAAPEAFVSVFVEKDQKISSTQIITLHNEIKTIDIPITEADLGGFAVHYQTVFANAYINGNQTIVVEKPTQNLDFEVGTFRDKMQPGAEQTWQFKLKGLKKDLQTAEILASMYDASLDQFKPHVWQKPYLPLYGHYWSQITINANDCFSNTEFNFYGFEPDNFNDYTQYFDKMNWFGLELITYQNVLKEVVVTAMNVKRSRKMKVEAVADEATLLAGKAAGVSINDKVEGNTDVEIDEPEATKPDFSNLKIRTNFNETAFFYPHLVTDTEGNISFNFTSPEALTAWKLQLLGHTQTLQTAYYSATSVTQKELMLLPNPPRFLREADEIFFSTKISNLTDKQLQGVVQLQLSDAVTGQDLANIMSLIQPLQNFVIDAKGNTAVDFRFKVPASVQAVQYKIVAQAGTFSDGEQNVLPVLSNRMLVTETLPLWVNSGETKTFTLNKLKNNTSSTLQHQQLTLEVTSNPVWFAIKSLPYLMEFPHECAEQTFARYYANALATKILQDNPKIKSVFQQWEKAGTLVSPLEKNENLKSVLIAETPWLREAQSETEQQKRIALLFDLRKMSKELENAVQKLYGLQMSNGGFPWFSGSRYPNRYITQYIAAGFGHLEKLGVFPLQNGKDLSFDESKKTHQMLTKAIQYLDNELLNDYNELLEQAKIIRERNKNATDGEREAQEFLKAHITGSLQLHYLYTRTFYPEIPINRSVQQAFDYFQNQSFTYWKNYGLTEKAWTALVAKRQKNLNIAQLIIKSLDENSITLPEMGMYWKENTNSWNWNRAPIETQALLIETFGEIQPQQNRLDAMKMWLLKNKQTNRWSTTKATTEAIFALLAYGNDWTNANTLVQTQVGNENVTPQQNETEAGTGYYQLQWNKDQITPEKAIVTLSKKDKGTAWGGLYWQYFEDLDKITFAETPLVLHKNLMLKQNTDSGELLTDIQENTPLKVGDLVRVRVEIKVDRDMEFVHLKDMRASGFEPVDVLSGYHYQDGLGYYQSTKDTATHFFFDYLPKGVYVLQYDVRANNAGNFSNGIGNIECMYAPEFTAHTNGVRVNISERK